MKENDTARINSRKSGEDRERASAAQGKKGGEIVLNTEQCRELNEKGDETKRTVP